MRMIREILPLSLLSLTPGRLSRTHLFVSCESQFLDFDFFSEGPDGDPEGFFGGFWEVRDGFCLFACVLEEPGRVSGRFGGVRAGPDVPWVTENR